GSGDSVGAGGVGPFSRAGAERRGVLCTPFAAGRCSYRAGWREWPGGGRGGPGWRWGVLCALFAGGALRRQGGVGGGRGGGGRGGGGPGMRWGGLCRLFAAGALLLQVGVGVVAGVRERWSWLALGRALHAVRSGGAAPTGWGRRVERGWGLVWEPRPPGRMAGASPPRGQDHS